MYFLVALGTLLCLVNGAPTKEQLLPKVLDAVDRAVHFFASDYSNINVDGLFGLRVAQGQLQETFRECTSIYCPRDLKSTLKRLIKSIERTSRKAMRYIEQESPEYFERFLETVASPYVLNYRPTVFPSMEGVKVGHNKAYDEEEGDACYARILGTFKERNVSIPRCNVTLPCLDLMTRSDTMRYTITHQLLYFIVIEKTGCNAALSEQMSSLTNQGIRDVENRLCKTIYKEASTLAEEGVVVAGSQDLFMEETILCGALGYEDFAKPKYISMVLKMQSHEGCFKIGTGASLELEKAFEHLKPASRKMLREQRMRDGCLSHKSGLGTATLAYYLRYLVRDMEGLSMK